MRRGDRICMGMTTATAEGMGGGGLVVRGGGYGSECWGGGERRGGGGCVEDGCVRVAFFIVFITNNPSS